VNKLAIFAFLFMTLNVYSQSQQGTTNGRRTRPRNGNAGEVPGEVAPDPKSLVPSFAPNARRLGLGSEISLSDLLILRSILLQRIGYGGREVGLWASANGNFVKEAESARVTTGGLIVAADKRFCDWLVLGLAGGYSHTSSTDLEANAGWGGAYAIVSSGGWYINQTAIGGGDGFTTTRDALGGTAKANGSGWFFSDVTQGGYNITRGHLTGGPYGLLQYALSGTPAFSESGSVAPVTVHSGTSSSIVSDLGLDVSYRLGRLCLKASAAWEHEYSDTTTFTTVNLVGIPSSNTTLAGTSLGHDSAVISAGISYLINRLMTVSIGYNGQFGRQNYESNSVSGSIRIAF